FFKPLLITLSFLISLINSQLLQSQSSKAYTTTWIQAGFWSFDRGFPVSSINSSSFTHLLCGFSTVDPSTFKLSISPPDVESFSLFTSTVRSKNSSITTLLSIRCNTTNFRTFFVLLTNSSSRESFINSSIEYARSHGFHGLDLVWSCPVNANATSASIGDLFDKWRDAIDNEANQSGNATLLLTATLSFWPIPIESVNRSLDWVHLRASEYHSPRSDESATAAHAAVYDHAGGGTDAGVKEWIGKGLPASKMVLSIPLYGYAWKLRVASADGAGVTGVGSPAEGAAISATGFFRYADVRRFVEANRAQVHYNGSYVVNYCSFGLTWIGYDDVEAVRAKVDYARRMGLRGYAMWQIPYDDNGNLSQVAASTTQITTNGEEMKKPKNPNQLLLYVLSPIILGIVLTLLITTLIYLRKRRRSAKSIRSSTRTGDRDAASLFAGEIAEKNPRMVAVPYSFTQLEKATNEFSMANKLGQGGYGPVYKGVLLDGMEIAVKKLSMNSSQGDEQFKNEVILTAQLQHVNLVRVLGFCIDGGERMLVYEYLPGNSLDQYLFDPVKRLVLNWTTRVEIIEGVTQGLLYLQEYSGRSIIHRDLKPGNILLGSDMKAKISDFGMARILKRDSTEANTERIAGTRAYCPPEYLEKGQYSKKSDVYSFGILLLQIISGKRCVSRYGPNADLELHVYAYEMWKEGKGAEIMDSSLDDTDSPCKLMTCLRIALLCIQRKPRDRPRLLEVPSMLRDEHSSSSSSAIENVGIKDVRAYMYISSSSPPPIDRHDSPEACSLNHVTMTELVARS
ncbi:Cysteine-rich receptor-like protein kinase 10, partial [Linum perenne]